MPPPSDHVRIVKGLIFLRNADKAAVRAIIPLEKINDEPNLSSIADLLDTYEFSVAGHTYRGKMTEEQYNLLEPHQGTQKRFADAVAKLIIYLNDAIYHAMTDLERGLSGRPTPPKLLLGQEILAPVLGRCTYDTGEQRANVTESFCEVGLQGKWDANDKKDGRRQAERKRKQ